MKVEPVLAYRRPKYPRIGEEIQPINSMLSKTIIAAALALTGVLPVYAGAQAQRAYTSEQEIVQILKYEAEKLGIALENGQDIRLKLSGSEIQIALNLYNEEKQMGAAVLPRGQLYNMAETLSPNDMESIETRGLAARGKREDEQDVNFFLTTEIDEYYEKDLRQAFREFIEWLQSEGII